MRQTIICVISVSLLLITLSMAAVIYGRLRPMTDPLPTLYDLQTCNHQPCYKGIVPGVTPLADAFAVLNRSFDASLTESAFSRTINILNMPTYQVFLDTHSGQIDDVTIQFNKAPPPLIYFVVRYGAPCFVEAATQLNITYVTLHYPAMESVLTVPYGATRLTSAMPVYSLRLYALSPGLSDGCASKSIDATDRQHWQGFTLFKRYEP